MKTTEAHMLPKEIFGVEEALGSSECANIARAWITSALKDEVSLPKGTPDEGPVHAVIRMYKRAPSAHQKSFDYGLYEIAKEFSVGNYRTPMMEGFYLISQVGNPQARYCLITLAEGPEFFDLSLDEMRWLLNSIADMGGGNRSFWMNFISPSGNYPESQPFIHQVISGLMNDSSYPDPSKRLMIPMCLPLFPERKEDANALELKLDILYDDFHEHKDWDRFVVLLKHYKEACGFLIQEAILTFLHEKDLM